MENHFIYGVVILLAAVLLAIGLASGNQLTEETLDQLEKLDTLEDRIREAREFMYNCGTINADADDYAYIAKILDPNQEYTSVIKNDF